MTVLKRKRGGKVGSVPKVGRQSVVNSLLPLARAKAASRDEQTIGSADSEPSYFPEGGLFSFGPLNSKLADALANISHVVGSGSDSSTQQIQTLSNASKQSETIKIAVTKKRPRKPRRKYKPEKNRTSEG